MTNPLSQVPRELAVKLIVGSITCPTVDQAEAVIREAMQRAQPQWISVEEKLPDEDTRVLFVVAVTVDDHVSEGFVTVPEVYTGTIYTVPGVTIASSDDGNEYENTAETKELIGWMPLPEPPNKAAASSLTEQETTIGND